MRFATVFKPVTIAKASKVRRPNGYARLEALNRRMSSAVQLNLLKGIKTFKKRIDPDALYEAWKTRDYSQVMRVIPWENMDQDLSFSPLGDALESATEIAIPVLPAPLQDTLRFDLANPRIRSYVDARTGDMVTALRQDSQAVIQEAISASFSEALSPRRVADRIKGSIGLYPRLDRAVERYREGLELGGAPPPRVELLVNAYRDRLLDYRAMNIARTETRRAVDNGQLEVWKQGADNGTFDRHTTKKVWIVDGDPCPICLPMDGVAVGLYDQWVVRLENGGTVLCDVPTDSHPQCLCTMKLEFEDTISSEPDSEESENDQPQDQEE